MKVSSLSIYPVKSCRGVSVDEALVTPRGFEGDRRFCIAGPDGEVLTQRTHPQMARIVATLREGVLRLSMDGQHVEVHTHQGSGERSVRLWGQQVDAALADFEASQALSDWLGQAVNLVRMDARHVRATDERYASGEVSFADGFPYLIAQQASLDHLVEVVGESFAMERFRPNIVVEGGSPWDEDAWTDVEIGRARFSVVKPCARCVMVTVDPVTGHQGAKEPLATLARIHRSEHGAIFGQNAMAVSAGITVRVGDAVLPTRGS